MAAVDSDSDQEALAHQLYELIRSKPVSIEILPPGYEGSSPNPHKPFEFAENNLGIPRNDYYMTYLQAIRCFESFLNRELDSLAKEDRSKLIAVSCVVLLVNPLHNTCVNKRRALVEGGDLSEDEELDLISSLQLLPACAKSPILWSYRRWLLRRLYATSSTQKERHLVDDLDDVAIPLEAVSRELAICTMCSEVYPRNYHAWLHRYKCLQSLASYSQHPHPPSNSAILLSQVLRAEEFAIRKWVDMNVSDYSAMQYLCFVYSTMAKADVPHIQMHLDDDLELDDNQKKLEKASSSPWDHSLELVQRYPTHEALWYYLRTAYALQAQSTDLKGLENGQDPYARNFERWRVTFDSHRPRDS